MDSNVRDLNNGHKSMTTLLLNNAFDITKVSKGAKIKNRYNQVQYLTQDTNGKVTNSQ